MTFEELKSCIPCDICVRGENYESARIKTLLTSDLMSDVLTTTEENFVMITSLNSKQVVHTADIVGALGILLVNGKSLPGDMKNLAEEKRLTLLSSPWNSFQVSMAIGSVLEKEKV